MIDLDKIVEKDHRLERSADTAQVKLWEHRWHWTADVTNPDRMHVDAYGKLTGKARGTIRYGVQGYINWCEDPSKSLGDHLERARMGELHAQTVEIIAEVYGMSFQYTRKSQANLVRQIKARAKERVENTKDTTYEEAVREIATWAHNAHEARQAENRAIAEKAGPRFIDVDHCMIRIANDSSKVFEMVRQVKWDDRSSEVFLEDVRRVEETLKLMKLFVSGSTDIDWDEALQRLIA